MYLSNTLKGNLSMQKNTKTPWLATTIKEILKIPIHKLDKPIFSFKRTKYAASIYIKILLAFNGNLGAAIEAQKCSSINYGSKFRDIAKLSKLFNHHKYNIKNVNIIQQGSCYHLSRIDEETRKYHLEEMIQRVNHKPYHSEMNSSALEKAISK